jgi:hypothetical protein
LFACGGLVLLVLKKIANYVTGSQARLNRVCCCDTVVFLNMPPTKDELMIKVRAAGIPGLCIVREKGAFVGSQASWSTRIKEWNGNKLYQMVNKGT